MLILVPHLFPSARWVEAACRGLRLPALESLLARGRLESCPADGTEAALCGALGVARQQDWPIAPITLLADGADPGEDFWLRADPVHLRVMRDRVVLAEREALAMTAEEATALAMAIGRHFGDELSPLPLHPQRWYLHFARMPRLTTTPRSVAAGRDVGPLQPQGEDAARLRAQLNELQMLLHDHPVNQAREARGELPINSLWLWGGGRLPVAPACPKRVYADDREALALAAFCGARTRALPTHPDAHFLKAGGIVLLDALSRAGEIGDAHGWRDALRMLERDWFVPFRAQLRGAGTEGLRLLDPASGRALHLTSGDAWRFWCRSRPLAAMLV